MILIIMVLSGLTKIPIANTSLNFTQTSQSQNNFGGYGSAQAQHTALQKAINQSRQANPDQFKDEQGNDFQYVSKVLNSPTPIKAQTIQRTQTIQATPIDVIKQTNFKVGPIQGPVKPISKTNSLGISQNKQGQTYNQYTNNIGGQIQDTILGTVNEMGKGIRNTGEDYYNMPGSIAGSDYKDKALINKSMGKLFEGDFEGAGDRKSVV